MEDWKEKAKAELKSILEREEGMMKAWTGAYDLACFIADKLDSEIEERKHYHQKAIWWEEQFSALRAELARVKAESLRVVCLPDDYEFMGDYYMTPTGIGWNGNDRHGDGCVETPEGYHKFDECKKVRFERWEDE